MATWNGTAEVLKIRTDLRNIPTGAYTVAIRSANSSLRHLPRGLGVNLMIRSIRIFVLFFLPFGILPLRSQDGQTAHEMLDHALHLADLYNWDDAGKDFAEAEKLFVAAGDQRNALYAKLGNNSIDRRPASTASNFVSAGF